MLPLIAAADPDEDDEVAVGVEYAGAFRIRDGVPNGADDGESAPRDTNRGPRPSFAEICFLLMTVCGTCGEVSMSSAIRLFCFASPVILIDGVDITLDVAEEDEGESTTAMRCC